jgi:hypothetical protein
VGYVAWIGERRGTYGVLVGKLEGKSHLEDIGVDGRILLTWILKKSVGRAWTGLILLRTGTSGRPL